MEFMRTRKMLRNGDVIMKKLSMRSLAWLTSLLMLISIFASLIVLPAEAATVNYVYDGKYVYNWGQRETVATFMSPMAEDWYEKNNTSYEELAALSGSSSTGSVPSSALYKELKDLMKSNHTYETSYSATKDLFRYTDCENSGGKISSFYSGKAIGPSWDGAWNREHTWPNSKGDASGNGENDIIMLRPTSTSENSSRGNKAYGESSGYYHPNSESGGKYDLRGDVARIMLFVYCRWGNTGSMWGSSGVMESLTVLLRWVTEDPVDTWELGRNDAAQSITGTRNVFVDYPELIFVMFGADIPDDYQSPSGEGAKGSFDITATSSNTAHGTVSVSGKNINASPKTGYAVGGYTILEGSATVVRNGNVFAVTPSSDVKIRIDFVPRTQVTLTLKYGSTVLDTITVYSGDEVTLPTLGDVGGVLPDIGGVQDVGWVETTIAETTEMPSYYAAGSKYAVGVSTTLYALISRTVDDGGAQSNVFEPYSGNLTPGEYIIVYEGKAVIGQVNDKTRLDVAEVTANADGTITPPANAVWAIAQSGDSWTLFNAAAGAYAAGTGYKSSNQATLNKNLTDFAKWTVAIKSGEYEFTNVGNDAAGVNPVLRFNPSVTAFACYAKNTNVGGPNKLYKRVSGTTYYYTREDTACDHTYESAVTTAATCGTAGVMTYTCSACSSRYTEVIPATGEHTYDDDRDADCNGCGAVREVAAYVPGDINGDGKVNNRDLAALQKHLNEWNVEVVDAALDTNGDGKVNNRDLAQLQKYLNEWDVELH